MTTIIDYGIGNLRSLQKAFEAAGVEVERTGDPAALARAERLVLPGVGAFGACASELKERDLAAPVLDAARRGVPLMGVCVGMQLLFDVSEERGTHAGLGLLPGRVVRFQEGEERLKVPHMGWNRLDVQREHPLLDGLDEGAFVYFVHSYHAEADQPDDVLASASYGRAFPAVVGRGTVMGAQFHPEKSGPAGLRLLRNFGALTTA
jgi:glutamine amidotransferase